jgi:pimeloyl-ACP methyl ester carboxylesterase
MPDSLRFAMAGRAHEVIESSDGVRIVLRDLGGPSGGTSTPVLLFSHATGFHGRVWEPMATFLCTEFRCVALDLRGHGMSELPSGATLAWSGMVDDVVAALRSDRFPIGPLHGIGHSMGGAALVLAAALRPDAFRSLWLYEPVIIPTEGWPLSDGDNPMSEGQRGVATVLTRWTRPMRIIDQSHPSTNCIPMLSGPMSTAASRPLQTARSRCAVGRRQKPRSFVPPQPAVHGVPLGRSRYLWPPWPGVLTGLGPELSLRLPPRLFEREPSSCGPISATSGRCRTPRPWPKMWPSGSEPTTSCDSLGVTLSNKWQTHPRESPLDRLRRKQLRVCEIPQKSHCLGRACQGFFLASGAYTQKELVKAIVSRSGANATKGQRRSNKVS